MMKRRIGKKDHCSALRVTILMLCINSICAAGFVEYTDEATFINQTGSPEHFIDFESYGDGTPVVGQPNISGNEWSNLGVQFSAIESGDSLILYDSQTKPEYVSPTHTLLAAYGSDITSYRISFSTPVMSFGVYIVDSETTSATEKIVLMDDNGYSEDFVMPVGPSLSSFFRGYESDVPITQVSIVENLDGEGLLLDNVMYSTQEVAAIPAPGALLLGSIGFGLVRVLRRRRAL